MLQSGWPQRHVIISANLLRRGQTHQYFDLTPRAGQLGMDGFPVCTSNTCMESTILIFESNQTNRVHGAERCTAAETISAASDQTHRNQRRTAKILGWTLKRKQRLVELDNEERAKEQRFYGKSEVKMR